jgi:poly(3-hydroxyalkanoate) synthetase
VSLGAACVHVRVSSDSATASVERHWATTSDGWKIELIRFRPKGAVNGRPVILCHGVASQGMSFDLDDTHSMAHWMAAQGRDTWAMSVRGMGASDRANESVGRSNVITVDDFALKDLPAVIKQIQSVTGEKQIDYVGHSMGGIMLYMALASGVEGISAGVSMGSPIRVDYGSTLIDFVRDAAPKLLSPSSNLPAQWGSQFIAPFPNLIEQGLMQQIFYNPKTTATPTWQSLLQNGTGDVPGGVALQLVRLAEHGRFESFDGGVNYKEKMRDIKVPVMVLAARGDQMVVTSGTKDAFRALGPNAEWKLISRANGAATEYGHLDLLMGDKANVEVWPFVLAFLNRHPR